ncbi:hypothetical protein GOBAR_DD08489 [Gossypium barbadense]|nr:hypothetical protein GOBAR_DD08489 [Gossypium barbadense]
MYVTYPDTAYNQSDRGDDMEGMLRDAFNMHNHGVQSFSADFVASDDCNIGGNACTEQGSSVLSSFVVDSGGMLRSVLPCRKIHRFRFQSSVFDGTEEFREAPSQTSGSEILFMLEDMNFIYGKMNQLPNTQRNRRSNDEADESSDEEDDPNEADLRKIIRESIVQNNPNSTETNSIEQQTVIGSSNVPITHEDPTEVQIENGGTRRGRGRTILRELYELDPVERVKVCRNSFGQPVGSEARLLAGYMGILA